MAENDQVIYTKNVLDLVLFPEIKKVTAVFFVSEIHADGRGKLLVKIKSEGQRELLNNRFYLKSSNYFCACGCNVWP